MLKLSFRVNLYSNSWLSHFTEMISLSELVFTGYFLLRTQNIPFLLLESSKFKLRQYPGSAFSLPLRCSELCFAEAIRALLLLLLCNYRHTQA